MALWSHISGSQESEDTSNLKIRNIKTESWELDIINFNVTNPAEYELEFNKKLELFCYKFWIAQSLFIKTYFRYWQDATEISETILQQFLSLISVENDWELRGWCIIVFMIMFAGYRSDTANILIICLVTRQVTLDDSDWIWTISPHWDDSQKSWLASWHKCNVRSFWVTLSVKSGHSEWLCQ